MRPAAWAAVLTTVIIGCGPGDPVGSPSGPPSEMTSSKHVLMAAGDIASCEVETDADVGELLESETDATVAALGDLVYPAGSDARYERCYGEAWGAVEDRTRPAIGNHDVQRDDGSAYFDYFGDAAGTAGEGWYAYELGAWEVVVLNTNCDRVGCDEGSAQHEWLLNQLQRSEAECVLAYFHHPIIGSGTHGRYPPVDPLWKALVAGGVDLVLAGHEHHYERFSPLDANGRPASDGVPLIIVGTGGYELRDAGKPVPGSEVLIDDTFGALRLTLASDGYEWQFLQVGDDDVRVRDSRRASCR